MKTTANKTSYGVVTLRMSEKQADKLLTVLGFVRKDGDKDIEVIRRALQGMALAKESYRVILCPLIDANNPE